MENIKSIREINTSGMELFERYNLLNIYKKIPVGTVVWEAGSFDSYEKRIIVTNDNQDEVTMFWNALYFDNKNDAELITSRNHAAYSEWQESCYY